MRIKHKQAKTQIGDGVTLSGPEGLVREALGAPPNPSIVGPFSVVIASVEIWLADEWAAWKRREEGMRPLETRHPLRIIIAAPYPIMYTADLRVTHRDLSDALVGLRVGQWEAVEFQLPADYHMDVGRNEPVVLKITVQGILNGADPEAEAEAETKPAPFPVGKGVYTQVDDTPRRWRADGEMVEHTGRCECGRFLMRVPGPAGPLPMCPICFQAQEDDDYEPGMMVWDRITDKGPWVLVKPGTLEIPVELPFYGPGEAERSTKCLTAVSGRFAEAQEAVFRAIMVNAWVVQTGPTSFEMRPEACLGPHGPQVRLSEEMVEILEQEAAAEALHDLRSMRSEFNWMGFFTMVLVGCVLGAVLALG